MAEHDCHFHLRGGGWRPESAFTHTHTHTPAGDVVVQHDEPVFIVMCKYEIKL